MAIGFFAEVQYLHFDSLKIITLLSVESVDSHMPLRYAHVHTYYIYGVVSYQYVAAHTVCACIHDVPAGLLWHYGTGLKIIKGYSSLPVIHVERQKRQI